MKERQTNIELCRIVSILFVLLIHTTYQTLGSNVSLGIMLLEGFTIIGVNVFVLITGYFSVTPKKTTLINIAFICLFWMLIKIIVHVLCEEPLNYEYFFFITSSNWFIPAYIMLILLAPMLNCFAGMLSKRQLWFAVLLFLLLEVWYDWLPPYPDVRLGTQNGASVLSFVFLYLLGRAIRLHGLPEFIKKHSAVLYMGASVLVATMLFVLKMLGVDNQGAITLCIAYNNPIVIFSSIAFFSFFENLKIRSKAINYIAKSTLSILLGHCAIFFLYTMQFRYLYNTYTGLEVVLYWILSIFIVFMMCVGVDQIRIALYKPIERFFKGRIEKNELIG